MRENVKLSSLQAGEWGYVTGVTAGPDMARRLADLGVVPGTRVTCELESPSGDPKAYRIRGALIALRRRDAGDIRVTPWQDR